MDHTTAHDAKFGDIKTTCARYGFGRSTAYELLNTGLIRAKKLGTKTLIEFASVEEYLASLPSFGEAA